VRSNADELAKLI